MKPCLHSNPALFALTVILATAIHFPVIWCQETKPYDICGQSVQCGNTGPQLEYPFWGLDRPAYCGRSDFELTCQSNVLLLRYESLNYRVLQIDGTTQTITVARNDLWSNNCPQDLYNTTYNTAVFNGGNFGQENLSLYYGCVAALLANNYRFNCAVKSSSSSIYVNSNSSSSSSIYVNSSSSGITYANSRKSDSYFFRTSLVIGNTLNYLEQCDSHIIVPVSRSSADRLASSNVTTDDLRSALTAGFNLQWTANNDVCDQCIQSGGRCGSNSTSPASFVCYCASGNFLLTCNNSRPAGKGGSNGALQKFNWKWKLVIGLSSSIGGIMLLLFVILCRKKRLWESRKATNHRIEMFIRNYGTLAPKRYKYSEIKKMSNSFQEKLGQGGYGSVYKGQLPDGHLVAVKLLGGDTGDGEDFVNEVASIGRTSHVNIVTLLGFCFEGKKRALVYEFMPNGSLDKFLRSDDESTNSSSRLDWNTLFQIAKGIARGLEYLHRGCNTRIVHFDIKPHNILLDEEFVPKISDFGLAKLCKRTESIVSIMGARGTAGYIAPEVFFKRLGGASHKSDVYSYGMMVLEMTGASKNNNARATSASEAYFPDWIYKRVEDGENLGVCGVTTEEEDELARKMMLVSLWCIQSDPSDRPSISKVVEMLEGSLQSLQAPPRHFGSSPTRPPQGSSPSAKQSSTMK